ncbi:hypothetical protein M422DRAFT_56409 [Sphaerobolus stellatus SS14]|uniref:DUF6818 domain-containing protein n=1 Tax=Sphaerobolus stellatus (strain SS14) TaxID=990650 RepID=A0A0C9U5T5_SPHS4|nr:hypothetical protein M422DRAFT_56409 [Sphaerobolus stellatus SS14]
MVSSPLSLDEGRAFHAPLTGANPDGRCAPTARVNASSTSLPPIHSLTRLDGLGDGFGGIGDDLPEPTLGSLLNYRLPSAPQVASPPPPPPNPPTTAPRVNSTPAPQPTRVATTAASQRRTRATPQARRAGAAEESKKRGRQPGVRKWLNEEIERLLDIVQEVLPIAGIGWEEVTRQFNEAAAFENTSARNTSALEGRFKKLHSTPPPTGDAEVPPEVQCALEINEAINAKAGVTVISDNDDYDVQDVSNDHDDDYINKDEDENPRPAKIVKPNTPNTSSKLNMKGKGRADGERPAAASSSCGSGSKGPVFVAAHSIRAPPAVQTSGVRRGGPGVAPFQQLADQLNPTEQAARTAARDEERSFRKFQEAEISNLRLQLLQLQSDNQRLRGGMLPPMRRSMSNAFSSSQRSFAASAGSSHASGSSSSSGTPTSPSENHAGPSHLCYDALEAGDEPLDENWEPTQQGCM